MSTTTNSPKQATTIVPMVTFFTSMFKDTMPKKVVKISEIRNADCVAGANVTIPMEVVDEESNKFANTLYGFFI